MKKFSEKTISIFIATLCILGVLFLVVPPIYLVSRNIKIDRKKNEKLMNNFLEEKYTLKQIKINNNIKGSLNGGIFLLMGSTRGVLGVEKRCCFYTRKKDGEIRMWNVVYNKVIIFEDVLRELKPWAKIKSISSYGDTHHFNPERDFIWELHIPENSIDYKIDINIK